MVLSIMASDPFSVMIREVKLLHLTSYVFSLLPTNNTCICSQSVGCSAAGEDIEL
jgi:hypothetical protein